MITYCGMTNNIITNTNKIAFENVVFENTDAINKKDIKKTINKKIKINGKNVNITLVVDKNNNIVIPKKIKKMEKKDANV